MEDMRMGYAPPQPTDPRERVEEADTEYVSEDENSNDLETERSE